MTYLATPKMIILELAVNADRNTVELIEQIAECLHVAIGEREQHEYVKLMHVRTINKEVKDATQPVEH